MKAHEPTMFKVIFLAGRRGRRCPFGVIVGSMPAVTRLRSETLRGPFWSSTVRQSSGARKETALVVCSAGRRLAVEDRAEPLQSNTAGSGSISKSHHSQATTSRFRPAHSSFSFCLLLTCLLRNSGARRYELQMNVNVEMFADDSIEVRRTGIIFLANTSRSLRKRRPVVY